MSDTERVTSDTGGVLSDIDHKYGVLLVMSALLKRLIRLTSMEVRCKQELREREELAKKTLDQLAQVKKKYGLDEVVEWVRGLLINKV